MTEQEYYTSLQSAKELYHHGIDGQQWGVKNGPPYPLDAAGKKAFRQNKKLAKKYGKRQGKETLGQNSTRAVLIPKGSKIYRTTSDKNESVAGEKYVTYYKGDRDFYSGPGADWIAYTQNKKTNDLSVKTYTLKEDLKIPSIDEVQKIYDEKIVKNNKALLEAGKGDAEFRLNNLGFGKEDLNSLHVNYDKGKKFIDAYKKEKGLDKDSYIWQEYYNELVDNTKAKLKNKESNRDALFVYSTSYGRSKYAKSVMINELKKRGYNAMTDEAGVGGHDGSGREARQTLILFDGDSVIDDSKTKTKQITPYSYLKSTSSYNKYRSGTISAIDRMKRNGDIIKKSQITS